MLEEEQVAFFLASRLITRGNKGTLLLTIMIIAMVFVNLIFLPSIIAGIVVLFNQQNIDYSYGNLVIEPREDQLLITNVGELQQKINRVPGVVASTPRYSGAATIVSKGKSTTPLLIAINPDDEKQVLKIHTGIASGDYLNDGDTMCGPHFCSMKITQEVRDFAKAQGVSDQDALKKGMEAKAVEFVKQGAEVYKKA